jgi:hypothetical protein
MWRDIDSLRRQNALSRQQNEELRKENEAIGRETEQIEQETAILRRQNKALAFLESRDFDKMVRELAGPGDGDARHPLDRVDVALLCEKLVEHGCDEEDIPFLLNALDLETPQGRSQTNNGLPIKEKFPLSTLKRQLRELAGRLSTVNTNKLLVKPAVSKPDVESSFANVYSLYSKISEDPELVQSLFQLALRDPSGALRSIVELDSKEGLMVTTNLYCSEEIAPTVLSNE